MTEISLEYPPSFSLITSDENDEIKTVERWLATRE